MPLQLTPDMRMARVLARHRGMITYAQLLGCGISSNAIARRVASGVLVHVDSGLYRSPQAPICWEQLAVAGCLINGPGGALCGLSAARVWGFNVRRNERVEVVVPHSQRIHTYGGKVVVLPSRSYSARDRVRCGEHYVTTRLRTILDLASKLTPAAYEQVVDDAPMAGRDAARECSRGAVPAPIAGGGHRDACVPVQDRGRRKDRGTGRLRVAAPPRRSRGRRIPLSRDPEGPCP
jgi:hypothetical protein